jgi:hypothetical protein
MAKTKPTGLLVNGSLKKSGVTFYLRGGQMVARTAHSEQPKRRTRGQFVARQQLAHGCRLWRVLKWAGEPLFEKTPTAYARFRTLMRRTPVVFTPVSGRTAKAVLLLPGMPVSDGVLPVVEQQLAEVEGATALVTSLTTADVHRDDTLRLYTLRQVVEGSRPMVRVSTADLGVDDFRVVDGRLALVGDDFADEMCGWALVHIRDSRCSSQRVVTRCTYYQQFTTEEAFEVAAESYGGLTKEVR